MSTYLKTEDIINNYAKALSTTEQCTVLDADVRRQRKGCKPHVSKGEGKQLLWLKSLMDKPYSNTRSVLSQIGPKRETLFQVSLLHVGLYAYYTLLGL